VGSSPTADIVTLFLPQNEGHYVHKQGVRAVDGFSCGYRGDNGTMCAVGCLIPDEHYSSEFEGYGATTLTMQKQINVGDNIELLIDLQDAHDMGMLRAVDWTSKLDELLSAIAEEHNLNYTPRTESEV
jgi:hypothetical protein